ncbi:MAG: MucB/RseB C-terminal domain-containing protein [Halioglobus sp.]|nr:MucB/RseB C-terminal domain-containing protein [Halioglobus sp.]
MLVKQRNRRSQAPLLVLLSLLLTAAVMARAAETPCPEADAAALEWLDKMSRSLRQVSYEGVVTLQRGKEMQVMQVSHSVDDGTSFERLTELTGQGAQVERESHPVDCIHPGDRMLRLEAMTQEDRCGIAELYRFAVADAERVAGRHAVRIRIEPRDMYRFGYMMALDRETGLLLKSQTITHGHQVLETMQFANLSYTRVPVAEGDDAAGVPAAGDLAANDVAVVHEAQHPGADGSDNTHSVSRAWAVNWLPRGFTSTDVTQGNNGRRTYTDGLTVFSVFLEDLDVEMRSGEGLIRQGGTTTYTRGLRIAGQPVLVTVIGEVPVNTARMVADSVSWVQ